MSRIYSMTLEKKFDDGDLVKRKSRVGKTGEGERGMLTRKPVT